MNRILPGALALATVLVACVDTTPLTVEPSHKDAGAAPDAATGPECRACLESDAGACHSAYDLCLGLPRCGDFMQCVFKLNCFAYALLEDRLSCSQPCINELDLTSSDPALPGILAVNSCTQASCRSSCVAE